TTDSNGNYSFPNLALGTYFVEEGEQAGWNQTSSDTKVILGVSTAGATVDFGNMAKVGSSTDKHAHGKAKHKAHKDKFENGHDNGKHKGWFKNGKGFNIHFPWDHS